MGAQLAHHWRQTGQDAPALAAGLIAGQLAAAAHAPAEALAHYRDVLDRWPRVPDAETTTGIDEITLREQAAEAASAAGDSALARDLADQVVNRIDATREPVHAALRLERLGRFSWLDGDADGAWRAYEDALRIMPRTPSVARARILAATAQSLMLQTRHAASAGYAEQAVAAAQAVGAPAELAHAQDTLGTNLAAIGWHEKGDLLIREAATRAAEAGDDIEVARCYINRSEALVHALAPEEAIRVGDEGVRYATNIGLSRVHAAAILGSVLDGLYELGRWDELDARFVAALDTDPSPWCMVPLLVPHCRAAIDRGDLDDAAADIAAIEAVPGAAADTQYGPQLCTLRALYAAARGDYPAARVAIDDASARITDSDNLHRHLEITAIGVRLEADAVDAGRHTSAEAAVRRVDGLRAAAAIAVTQVVAAGGRLSPAMAFLDELAARHSGRISGVDDADAWSKVASSPFAGPYARASAHYHAAVVHLRRRSRRKAAEALAEAGRLAADLGARPLSDAITNLIRQARIKPGATPVRAEPERLDLTARERQVIGLLDAGMSNARIGKTLFISEKTASVHVSNILRKLGLTSRLQAANAARSEPGQQ